MTRSKEDLFPLENVDAKEVHIRYYRNWSGQGVTRATIGATVRERPYTVSLYGVTVDSEQDAKELTIANIDRLQTNAW